MSLNERVSCESGFCGLTLTLGEVYCFILVEFMPYFGAFRSKSKWMSLKPASSIPHGLETCLFKHFLRGHKL
jgi:hypothetical protein